jgi:hypothetical protein
MRMLAVAAAIVLVIAFCLGDQEHYSSICTKTGMVRFTQAFGPFKFHGVRQTALSRVLTVNGYRDPGQHQWVYAQGNGYCFLQRRFCALGDGHLLYQSVNSPKVASTVRLLIANSDKPTVEKWLRWIFDPEMAHFVSFYTYDVDEHTNRQEFIQWLQQCEQMIQEDETNRCRL